MKDPTEIPFKTNICPELQEHLWVVVLAGGEGERLPPLAEKWLGCHCPNQYCTFVSNRSMLEHVLAGNPATTILIFPSDHFVFPQKRFSTRIADLVDIANRFNDQIVMLGAKTDRAEADYGWIKPGQTCVPSSLDSSNWPPASFLGRNASQWE